ncbi:GntR family transcriptional regulator [Oenococcus sicerae]|uniref:GntR family transcriptional regulator n=1 Tax=Oenococcus sicerae TaxID=2203724 RepID=A0AAJ1R886_9LACO|nr:GntR family transcriptional regulator [Oenococcus sicerae]MDN6899939.1 GntR family transcriptional regulator [Oenococcus sicerae]QAS69089.1 GntR family transcriptional regulator [Oenococcus sicerae]
MAKYIEIANILRKDISNHKYSDHDPFPDQKTLAKIFATSRMTIQKSLNILSAEGLIHSKQGSGTFVSKNADLIVQTDLGVDQYVGTTSLLGNKHVVESQIIKFLIRYPDNAEQEALNISEKELLYDIIRLRIVDKEPYALEYSKMPVKVIPGISDEVLKKSVYHYIQSDLGFRIGSAFRKIGAVKPDNYDKMFLNCVDGDPVLEVSQTVYLDNGIAFEFSRTRHRYDKGNVTVFVKSNLER